MTREQIRFLNFIRKLNKEQQTGLLLTLEGLLIMADKQKSGNNR